MIEAIQGLHHITAICASPQDNIDFYVRTLGRRLVKRTVNFDDPGTYHLYYGDRVGAPGSILTFFPFVDAGPGRCGVGMASALCLAAPTDGFGALIEKLAERGVDFDGPFERFGEPVITFADPDRLPVECVEERTGANAPYLLKGVTLWVDDPEPTARVLTELLGLASVGEEEDPAGRRCRLVAEDGAVVDLLQSKTSSFGRQGAGTIHHVAFRTRDRESQQAWRARIEAFGLDVTPIIDRQYFDAIYFQEPGGVLFEIATDPPGFSIDEPIDTLGETLKLPLRYEARRADIERILPPLCIPR